MNKEANLSRFGDQYRKKYATTTKRTKLQQNFTHSLKSQVTILWLYIHLVNIYVILRHSFGKHICLILWKNRLCFEQLNKLYNAKQKEPLTSGLLQREQLVHSVQPLPGSLGCWQKCLYEIWKQQEEFNRLPTGFRWIKRRTAQGPPQLQKLILCIFFSYTHTNGFHMVTLTIFTQL